MNTSMISIVVVLVEYGVLWVGGYSLLSPKIDRFLNTKIVELSHSSFQSSFLRLSSADFSLVLEKLAFYCPQLHSPSLLYFIFTGDGFDFFISDTATLQSICINLHIIVFSFLCTQTTI